MVDTFTGTVVNALNTTEPSSITPDSLYGRVQDSAESIGSSSSGMAVTDVLFVSPNGDNTDGSSWSTAYTTIQAALDAASTDADDFTLILIGPHTTYYDIDTTGDPTWTGNYELRGSHRQFVKIMNDHASATSIMKFTGKVALRDLNINLGTGVNGVIVTKGGYRIDKCMFVGEDLTGAATAIHADGATLIKNGKIRECDLRGEATSTHMTGILLDNAECADILDTRVGFAAVGLQQVGANSNYNRYKDSEFCTCAIGADVDAGGAMSFENVLFYGNTLNIDDEVGGHTIKNPKGEFPIMVEPDNFTGVAVDPAAGADTWTATPVEVRAAATSTKPFKIVGVNLQADASEKYRVRLSADNGTTWFDDFQFEGDAAGINTQSFSFNADTDFVFNAGTQITAESKSESGGNGLDVWLKVQEI